MLRRSSARYILALFILDVLSVPAALFIARWLRWVIPWGEAVTEDGSTLRWPIFLMAMVLWALTLIPLRVYDAQRLANLGAEIWSFFVGATAAMLAMAGLLYFSYRGLSRLLYVYFYVLDLLLGLVARAAVRASMLRRRRDTVRRVLILGAGDVGQRVAQALAPCAWMGIDVVGFADDEQAAGSRIAGLPVFGDLDGAAGIVREREIGEVIIALPMHAHRRLTQLVGVLQGMDVNIKVVPDYSESIYYRSSLEQFGDLVLIGLKEPVLDPIDRAIKRLFDILLSLAALIVLSPVLVLIALLVVLTSPGPVLYKSPRVGEGGRAFSMLKFRTMCQGADKSEGDLVQETDDGYLVFDKRPDDPRITRIGHLLRRYSLDELPQLINVLLGQMSFVGPRPELPSLVAHYEPWQRKRFGVPQGMTGWWQINGRSNKAKHLHVEDDLYYIQNYSLWLDLRIIARTLGAVVRGEGAY